MMIESYNQNGIKEKIDRYVNGQLSNEEIEELWAELIQDEYHLEYLKSVVNIKAVFEKRESKTRITKIQRYWSYAAAAVIALTLGVLTVLNYPGIDFNSGIKPVDNIELDYYRSGGDATEGGPNNEIISNAIALANSGKFEEAVALLEKELGQTDDARWTAEIHLNLGSLFYNKDDYQKAVSHYNEVLKYKDQIDVLTLEKAYWYVGNAYFQLGQLDKAQTAITKAYDLNGAYRRVAQSYLKALAE